MQYVEVPGSSRPESRQRNHGKLAVGAMVFAACALATIMMAGGSSEKPSAMSMARSASTRAAAFQQHFQSLQDNSTAVGDGAAAPKFAISIDKIKFPTTWEAFQETFGSHLWWTLFVFFCAALTWGYVNHIRPRIHKEEPEGDESLLDENDVTANLILIPGEEIFFHSEEPFTSGWAEILFCGCGNRVWKLGVTNKRIVAQKKESTCFGTCQLNAREDCWPVENVSKVSVISGEFWGYSIPQLWDTAIKYLFITLFFDLAHGIVRESVKEIFGAEAADPEVQKLLVFVNIGFVVVCNVLFVLAVIYAIAVMSLIIFPHSLVKVYMTREMEEEGNPLNALCCGCHCRGANSKPMETFTFRTGSSYKAYAAIMAARAGAGNPTVKVSGP